MGIWSNGVGVHDRRVRNVSHFHGISGRPESPLVPDTHAYCISVVLYAHCLSYTSVNPVLCLVHLAMLLVAQSNCTVWPNFKYCLSTCQGEVRRSFKRTRDSWSLSEILTQSFPNTKWCPLYCQIWLTVFKLVGQVKEKCIVVRVRPCAAFSNAHKGVVGVQL